MNESQPLPVQKPKTGLSITSFVLGLFSVTCLSVLTGIPAIITGHIAHGRTKREPSVHGGAGFAIAGMIMGYLSIVMMFLLIPILAALLLPALAKAKQRAQTIQCVNNMKQIGLAARIYSNDQGGNFPPSFQAMSNEVVSLKVLICPGDRQHTAATDWSQFNADLNVSYEFLIPNAKEAAVTSQTVFRCPIHENIGLGDGSVQQGSGRRH
jgi:type II secretory pathway pseudopilin PulG